MRTAFEKASFYPLSYIEIRFYVKDQEFTHYHSAYIRIAKRSALEDMICEEGGA